MLKQESMPALVGSVAKKTISTGAKIAAAIGTTAAAGAAIALSKPKKTETPETDSETTTTTTSTAPKAPKTESYRHPYIDQLLNQESAIGSAVKVASKVINYVPEASTATKIARVAVPAAAGVAIEAAATKKNKSTTEENTSSSPKAPKTESCRHPYIDQLLKKESSTKDKDKDKDKEEFLEEKEEEGPHKKIEKLEEKKDKKEDTEEEDMEKEEEKKRESYLCNALIASPLPSDEDPRAHVFGRCLEQPQLANVNEDPIAAQYTALNRYMRRRR